MIRAIAHPTDFSPEGQVAFAHALGLAVANRCPLDLLHVRGAHYADHYEKFPHIREVLMRWGVLGAYASVEDIAAVGGVRVRKVEIRDGHAAEGLAQFLSSHLPDLLVMATHGREGLNRWIRGSISSEVARKVQAPVMLFGPAARPFIDLETGEMRLHKILVPIAHDPAPLRGLHILKTLMDGLDVTIDVVHIGSEVPHLLDSNGATLKVRQIDGPVIDRILEEAGIGRASLIAMPTAGHHVYLDALRGSTTEQIVAKAPCPVVALPA